jgi:crotonobetainyl-CoA:carnitine CoA-transferase CaiB-like acyl-CoA transferase
VGARPDLAEWLGTAIQSRSRDELLAALAAADVPAGPVNRVSQAVAMVEAAGGGDWVQEADGIRMAPDPIRVDGGRLPVRLPPPRLGEHTGLVLAELDQDAV